ncbi:hypothetical protein BDV96DRAFT_663318 [Lophiotrema nucula]|uniref:Uncharacterized protein n=1 Tax=Lophiotrema nucula TaxID=690887 RepID=A0A6A5ZTH9_9PLEO|nr:hypothetical protein BDV96DRAFT_663318 [Lophiotrema nucula]
MKLLMIVAAFAAFATAAPQVGSVDVAASVPLPVAARDTNCDECADIYRYCMDTSVSWLLNDDKSKINWQNDHCTWICAKRTCVQHEHCKNSCGWDKCDYSNFQNERPATPVGFKPPSPYEDKRNT